jgi:hypothetical protein
MNIIFILSSIILGILVTKTIFSKYCLFGLLSLLLLLGLSIHFNLGFYREILLITMAITGVIILGILLKVVLRIINK